MVEQYIAYFRRLAEGHRGIRGFCMMDAEAALVAMQENSLEYPCLMLETLSGRYADSHRDNPLNLISGGFLIADRCEPLNDFAQEARILDATFAIGAQVIARMNDDVYRRNALALSAIRSFEPDQVKWQQEGPLLDNAFGTLFTFPIAKMASLEVDGKAWHGWN
jgi:hypothetical protein